MGIGKKTKSKDTSVSADSKKPMPENLLLDIIFNHYDTRSEFIDWKETVVHQLNLLYEFKEKHWELTQDEERRQEDVERGIKFVQSVLNRGDN